MKDSHRLFFALWPPAEVAAALYRQAEDLHDRWGGRVMRQDTLHLTLAFLGNVTTADLPAISAVADGVAAAAFDLKLIHLSYWAHNAIVHAGCSPSPGLDHLARTLRQACVDNGFLETAEGFSPHLTLLRKASPGSDLPEIGTITWPVESFVLVESRPDQDGAHYRVLGRWNLGHGT